jgi:hypothetical protein
LTDEGKSRVLWRAIWTGSTSWVLKQHRHHTDCAAMRAREHNDHNDHNDNDDHDDHDEES